MKMLMQKNPQKSIKQTNPLQKKQNKSKTKTKQEKALINH